MIRLFELSDGKIKPTEHCETIKWLRAIKNNWDEKTVLKIYAYIFYMSYEGEENPFFNFQEDAREDVVLKDIELDFEIVEEEQIVEAVNKAKKMYETPSQRAYMGIKNMLGNLSDYMGSTSIKDGRDGNISALVQAAKNFDQIRKSFKGVAQDLKDEQKSHVRGDQDLAYDQNA